MSQLADLRTRCGVLEMILINCVEELRTHGGSATPAKVAEPIGGAPINEVRRHLDRLVYLGVLDKTPDSYRVTPLGAELARAVDPGWVPLASEQKRRDYELAQAALVRA